MKVLAEGKIEQLGLGYEVKIEDGKLKVAAVSDLTVLVDKGMEAIPGDNPLELMFGGILKQSLKAL